MKIHKGKNRQKFPVLLAITFTITIFLSCSGEKKASPESDYSENGIALSQKTIDLFTDLNKIIENQTYQEEFLKIVNDLSPETYVMKSESDHSMELENIYKINAFRNLERVFMAYNLQLDPNVSTSAASLSEKIDAACHSLDSMELDEDIMAKNEQIKKHVASSKFRIEETIFMLTELYADLWNEESQKWFLLMANYQEETDKGIKNIPTSAFNAEKLKTLVDEPYSNGAMLANIYKLKLVKENQVKITALQNQMMMLSESFSLLLSIQGELMKRKKDKLKVQELNNRLEMLLSN